MCFSPRTHTLSPPRFPHASFPAPPNSPTLEQQNALGEGALTLPFSKENQQLRNKDRTLKISPLQCGAKAEQPLEHPGELHTHADLKWDCTDNKTTLYRPEVSTARVYSLPASFPSPAFTFKSKKKQICLRFPCQQLTRAGLWNNPGTRPVAWSPSTRREGS